MIDIYTISNNRAILLEISTGGSPRRANRHANATGWKVKSFHPAIFVVALNSDSILAEEMIEELMNKITQACDEGCRKDAG